MSEQSSANPEEDGKELEKTAAEENATAETEENEIAKEKAVSKTEEGNKETEQAEKSEAEPITETENKEASEAKAKEPTKVEAVSETQEVNKETEQAEKSEAEPITETENKEASEAKAKEPTAETDKVAATAESEPKAEPVIGGKKTEEDSSNKEETLEEDDIEGFDEEDEEAEEKLVEEDTDFDSYEKKDFADLAEKMLAAMDKSGIKIPDVKNIDAVINEINPIFDDLVTKEKVTAKEEYIKETGSQDGFDYKNDNFTIRYESALIQIREKRKQFFASLEERRESYFDTKTKLIQRLREVVEREEKGASKENWEALKAVQEEWRSVGNMQSPHNGSLWSAYNALNDRFFDIRSIQNELKELDRKKNLEAKEKVVVLVEEMAKEIKAEGLTNAAMKKANELLNDYKTIGPGIRSEQEVLWKRMKAAFDIIYDKKRELNEDNQKLAQEIYEAKAILVDKITGFESFTSESINEWNKKTKEVMEVQNQWNSIKGPMPRDKAKSTSKAFWGGLKTFFKNKSEFFKVLETQREDNYKQKLVLCEEAEAILASEDTSGDNTNKIIGLQKKWKTIGHVPRKHNDSIYKRFKTACDSFFDIKRGNKEQLEEYEANLEAKKVLISKINKLAKNDDVDLEKLKGFKEEYNKIGFVPRKNIKEVQENFINSINSFVKASADLGKEETEKLILKNEVDVTIKSGGGSKNLQKQEYDIQRKMKGLEDEMALLRNNIEFFGHSKNAEKMKADYQKKIDKFQEEWDTLKDKLKLIRSVE